MDSEMRKGLMARSNISKKTEKILENREDFINKIKSLVAVETSVKDVTIENEKIIEDNSDMIVCVRIRPRLQEEIDLDYFEVVQNTDRNEVTVFDPSFDVRGKPKISNTVFKVDHVFGPEKVNGEVYSEFGSGLVDLALQGGICSILSYGQTGAGKTYTMDGMLELLASDLFQRQQHCKGKINLYFSCFEILGDELSDLQKVAGGCAEKEAEGPVKGPTDSMLQILEDKFGKIQVKGATEKLLDAPDHLKELIFKAAGHRRTRATFKNDASSRSHAVYRIRIENESFKSAEDGQLFVIDLAGSENSSDSQFHDKERIKETRKINTSLMALKECIINRAKASMDTQKHFHIPFRQSKLTLLLKDAFELESHKICKTIVFANVMPTLVDTSMTLNTLRYVAPIKEGMKNRVKLEPDPNSPMNWDNEKLCHWFTSTTKGLVDTKVMCPYETGRQILRIPEVEFLDRLMASNPKIGDKKAKAIYDKLWGKLIDARVASRKKIAAKEAKNKKQVMDELNRKDEELRASEGSAENIYTSIIEDNLNFKGVYPVVIMSSDLKLLGQSVMFDQREVVLRENIENIQNNLEGADEISFAGGIYTKLEATADCWKGQRKTGTGSGILRIDRLKEYWFISASQKLNHSTLEKFIEAPVLSLQPDYAVNKQ